MKRLLPLIILVAAGCPSAGQDASHASNTITSNAPKFSADTAFALMKAQVAFGPRVPGREAHQKQLAWMLQYLRSRADTVIEQKFTFTTTKGVRLTDLSNVFARFNPAATD